MDWTWHVDDSPQKGPYLLMTLMTFYYVLWISTMPTLEKWRTARTYIDHTGYLPKRGNIQPI